jgi:hypothetical protein
MRRLIISLHALVLLIYLSFSCEGVLTSDNDDDDDDNKNNNNKVTIKSASLEYRLKMAKEGLSFGGEERTEDDKDDISMLYEQIDEDLEPFRTKRISKDMTRKAWDRYAVKNFRGFGFSFVGNELYLATRRPTKEFNGHHARLIYMYFNDICEAVGLTNNEEDKGETIRVPDVEMALSTFDYNFQDEEQLPVLCFCKDLENPSESGCILHPGFGFRASKIDKNVYANREEFDKEYPWSSKDEKLIGRFSMYSRAGRHSETRARKIFVDFAENRTEDIDVKAYNKISLREHMKHKYILHLDGQGHSFQFEEKLGMNSVVVSEKKLFQTYFSKILVPKKHYLEFWQNDKEPEDIIDVLKWARENDDLMQKIAKNGQDFAHKYLTKKARLSYYRELFARYAKLLDYEVVKPEGAIRICCPGDYACRDDDILVEKYSKEHL